MAKPPVLEELWSAVGNPGLRPSGCRGLVLKRGRRIAKKVVLTPKEPT
jgi:hypothetical protein